MKAVEGHALGSPWGMEVKGRDHTWARQERGQGGLAIWLELEAMEACRFPHIVCGLGGPLDSDVDKHGHRSMQTAPNSDTHDRHRPAAPRMDRWGHSNSRGQEPTATRMWTHRSMPLKWVGAHSPRSDPEGGSEGHSGKLG